MGKHALLDVWMNGEKTGQWRISSQGIHEFAYAPAWLESPYSRPISLSMPMRPDAIPYKGQAVEAYFDNLLPDNPDIRRRVQARVGAASTKAMDLLAEIGRDCAGALQFLPAGSPPPKVRRIESDALDEAGVAESLRERIAPLTLGQRSEEEFRLSLAGAQEKTAFLYREGRWHRPRGATPTTHIFKFPMGKVGSVQGDLSESVENEWLCSQIVRGFGLPVAACEMGRFEDQRVLIVERFDRRLSPEGTWWLRLPQEDMCQALGSPVGVKYESDGGPGMAEILNLLLGAKEGFQNRCRFFKSQILFWILCAPDGHARNFSVSIEQGGRFALTPLYDVISAYPILGRGKNKLAQEKVRMAMSVHGNHKHRHWNRIQPAHWIRAAHRGGLGSVAGLLLEEISRQAGEVAAGVASKLPPGFPASVADPILEGMVAAAKKLADQDRISETS